MGRVLTNAGAVLHEAVGDDPVWRALADEVAGAAARLHPSVGAAAMSGLGCAGAALVDRRGRLDRADARFRDWIGEPAFSADCRRLVARAAAGRPTIGLVTALDGRVALVFARRFGDGSAGLRSAPVLLIAFAPLQPSALARRAGAALGLSPLEAKVAEALRDAPSIAAAADRIGLARKTARDALARAMLKAGVRRASDLVRRLADLDGC